MGILLTVDSEFKICIIDNACVLFIMQKDHMSIMNNVVSRINMGILLTVDSEFKICIIDNACGLFLM